MHPDPTPTDLITQPAAPIISGSAATGSLGISAENFEAVIAANYDPTAQEILRFWFFTARERNWSISRIERETNVSTTVISRLFRGIYPADPRSAIATLAKARDTFRESAENPEFIETSLCRRMWAVFDKTRALRNVSILWGPMGIGKTECIEEYRRRNNHGRTQVVRAPAGANFSLFLAHLARSCGVNTRTEGQYDRRKKILAVLAGGQRLLILDELHQLFLTSTRDCAIRCCELLREIADVSNCGLVLVGTEVLEDFIFRSHYREALRQLVDRGTVQVPLPGVATREDYTKFLAAYGLAFPSKSDPIGAEASIILADIIKTSGLRKLTLHLRDGASYAAKLREPYTWEHFVAAHDAIQSLSK